MQGSPDDALGPRSDQNDWRRSQLASVGGHVIGMLVAAGALAAAFLIFVVGERDTLNLSLPNVVASATVSAEPGSKDPLAWDPAKRTRFEQRAALGLSHVLYEKSPDGIAASIERTERYHDDITAAAGDAGIDPDTLEAVILLESAGRPDVMAGPTPDSAAGLAQIIPSTATDLLGMKVDLASSTALTSQIEKATEKGKGALASQLEAKRRAVDERFDPKKAIAGAAKYLQTAGQHFGDPQLAVVSYHMGIGNLDSVIGRYTAKPTGNGKTAQLVDDEGLSYAQLYFDSSPTRHPGAWKLLAGFGDDSSTYLWRVLAAEQALSLYRADRPKLDQLNELQTNKATLEEVFHPMGSTEIFTDGNSLKAAISRGDLVPLPIAPSLGFRVAKQMGELAPKLGESPALFRALRPESLAALTYIGSKVRAISGVKKPLIVTSSVRDIEYQKLLIGINAEATHEYSLHTTGYSFDILRKYANGKQADAFQFVLDRMRALGLLDYAYEPTAIHVTVSNYAKELAQD